MYVYIYIYIYIHTYVYIGAEADVHRHRHVLRGAQHKLTVRRKISKLFEQAINTQQCTMQQHTT